MDISTTALNMVLMMHIRIVRDDFYELFEAEDVDQPQEGVNPLTLDKKSMPGYVDEEFYRAHFAQSDQEDSSEAEMEEDGGDNEADGGSESD
jgi:hypothetical protein